MTEQVLVVADYASLEIGIQGGFAMRLFGDEQIIKAYDAQAAGVDMHSNNARSVFGKWLGWVVPPSVVVEGQPVLCTYAGERVDAIPAEEFKKHPHGAQLRNLIKAVFYGMAYGKGAYGFSTLIGADGKMIGEVVAGQMVNALLDAVPAMRRWFQWVEEYVREFHGIYSLGGRWCDLSAEMESADEWMHKRAFRRAYNFPFQATAAEIIGTAMVSLRRDPEWKDLGFRVVLQVHDELVCRGPLEHLSRATEILVAHMVGATANGTPLLFRPQVSSGHGPDYYTAK